jgi:TRAP-type mannitol/chloroaromatic compound transport system substrate-binding protein
MRKFFAALAGALVVTLLVTGWSFAADVYKWDIPFYGPRGTKDFKVLEKWCADLKAASGGRLDFNPLGGGEIMPVIETFGATSKGMLKVNFSYDSYWTGKLAVAGFASGLPPFTLQTRENWTVLYNSYGLEGLLQKAYGEHNIRYVRAIPTNNCVMLSKFPIRTVADLKGKKLRATGLYAEVLAAAGASPVFFPFGEIYGALEKGAIQGVAVGPLSAQVDSAFHEVSKYFLKTALTPVDAFSLHVNMDAWNALPEDLKALLYAFSAHASELFTNHYFHEDVLARAKMTGPPWKITETILGQKDMDIMIKHGMAVLDKYSAKDKYFAEATAMLKKYKQDLGI